MDKESETAGIISLASEGKWDIILISHSKRKSVIAVAIHSTLHRNKHLYTHVRLLNLIILLKHSYVGLSISHALGTRVQPAVG